MNLNPLLNQLHDIDGLDPIGFWPLAIGWWILIAAAILLGSFVVWLIVKHIAYSRSWKKDTLRKLKLLESQLSESTSRETVIALSQYIRRIALRRFSRKECAGLVGRDWLKWLKRHDPKEYDWEANGTLLIDVPYTPHSSSLPTDKITNLIQAIRHWVR